MRASRRITDFIVLEDGNIGHKAAIAAGAILASTVLASLFAPVAEAHCNIDHHDDWYDPCHYNGHGNYCWIHTNNNWHQDNAGQCGS